MNRNISHLRLMRRLYQHGILQRWLPPVCIGWVGAASLVWALNWSATPYWVGLAYTAVPLLPALIGALWTQSFFAPKVIPEIDAINEMEALGPLIDALDVQVLRRLFVPKRLLADAVRDAVKRLLARIEPEDRHLLNAGQWKRLHRSLFPIPDGRRDQEAHRKDRPDLEIAVLKALARIGDAESLATVERLIRTTQSGQIRMAAERCRDAIRARLNRAEEPHTLLRGSTAPPAASPGQELLRGVQEPQTLLMADTADSAPRDLLRGAGEPGQTAPQHLLRAFRSEDDTDGDKD